jgi:hypothetical protein
MPHFRHGLPLLLLLLPLAPLPAETEKSSGGVVDRVVSYQGKKALPDALQELKWQTGITVASHLGKDAPDVSLDLQKASFWQAVDALARAASAKPVQSARDGSITLEPFTSDDRRPPVSYDGPFRVRVTRITVSREFDSDRGTCVVGLEVSWTPTLRPLFLESQPRKVVLTDGKGKRIDVPDEGGSLVPVDGRYNFALEASLPALPRDHKVIRSLQGRLAAVTPTRMVRFSFGEEKKDTLASLDVAKAGGEERTRTREGVVCRVAKVVLGRDSWSVQMTLEYPEGNRQLESFQAASLVANNELVLTSADGKRKLLPSSSLIDQVGSRKAVVTYHFTDSKAAPRGKASDWKLAYTAPARVVEVGFGFAFEDLPLP